MPPTTKTQPPKTAEKQHPQHNYLPWKATWAGTYTATAGWYFPQILGPHRQLRLEAYPPDLSEPPPGMTYPRSLPQTGQLRSQNLPFPSCCGPKSYGPKESKLSRDKHAMIRITPNFDLPLENLTVDSRVWLSKPIIQGFITPTFPNMAGGFLSENPDWGVK